MQFTPYVYNDEEAIRYIASRTGYSEDEVGEFVRLRTRYSELISVSGFKVRAEIAEERRLNADLLPEQECCEDPDLLTAYVCRHSRIPAPHVAEMIAEETSYMVAIKIMDSDSYPDLRAWADSHGAKKAPLRSASPINLPLPK